MENDCTIHYLGPEASHTHEAANQFARRLGIDGPSCKPESSIAQVINDVAFNEEESSHCYGCVPLENSIQGSVIMTWDHLFHTVRSQSRFETSDTQGLSVVRSAIRRFGIHAVITLPIEHYLLSFGSLEMARVTHIYSHPQAFAQCRIWLETNLNSALCVPVSSTAEAARKVSESQDPSQVAIGSIRAATHYGLGSSTFPIQDVRNNCTRFGLLANSPIAIDISRISHFMTSVCLVGVSNQPGGLLKALHPFHANGLNMSRIESRPVGNKFGEYLFYLDIEHRDHSESEQVVTAWTVVSEILRNEQIDTICLGSYPVLI